MDLNQYFYRRVIFSRQNNRVSLVDIYSPEKKTALEEWMGTVLSLADGQHSVLELYQFMQTQYREVPKNLLQTIQSVIERLLDAQLIALSDNKVELPYYLANPIEQLDIEKAKSLISLDGYTAH